MKHRSLIIALAVGFTLGSLPSWSLRAEADPQGEVITKQKTIQKVFNEENPEGTIDLKKIVEEELVKPPECDEAMVTCQIKAVSFDITLKKEWVKLNIAELNDYDYANTVPTIKSELTRLTKPEVVVLQETLARRGLLQNLDGSIVKERGFFGSLTWLGLLRLANIKGLDPGDPKFNELLRDKVNELLDKMGKDQSYISNNALPSRYDMTPQEGSPLREMWEKNLYLSKLAQNAERVNPGNIPLNNGVDVNIDGFVNVERVSD
ncbi:MAG: hypothetical protein AB7J40_00095 [Candidatus Altimarinota bacterium]